MQRLSGEAPFNCSPCGAMPLESMAPWGVAAMPRRAIQYWRGYALNAGQARPRKRRKNKGIPFLFAFRGGVTFLGAAARKRVFDTFPYFIPTPAFPTHRCFGEGNPEFPFSGREIGLFVSRHSLLIDVFAPCRKSLIQLSKSGASLPWPHDKTLFQLECQVSFIRSNINRLWLNDLQKPRCLTQFMQFFYLACLSIG
jgi:hypothetical protein